jgi:Zn-dependent protease/CBS domain-containing protein
MSAIVKRNHAYGGIVGWPHSRRWERQMKQTVRLGRVAGIPVGAHWSVLVIMMLLAQSLAMVVLPAAAPGRSWWIYWLVAVVTAALFLASLLAHEVAHALVARRYGMRVERVTLWLLGGVAELGGQPSSPRVDLRVAVVGPLTSVAAGGVFFAAVFAGAGLLPRVCVAALSWLAWINVVLAVFNLLPAAPLDGGRVLRALLWRRWGDQARAQVTAAKAGRVLGGGLIWLGLLQILAARNPGGIWLALVGWFLIGAADAERRATELASRLRGLTVRAAMTPHPAVGRSDQNVQEFLTSIACRSRQREFPVLGGLDRPVGMTSLAALARIPPALRPQTPLARASAPAPTVEADRPLAEAAPLMTPSAATLLVVDQGPIVGVLHATDIARATDLAALGLPPDLQRPDTPAADVSARLQSN